MIWNLSFALDESLNSINRLIDNSEYSDALIATETLIESHPNQPRLIFLKANILEKSGKHHDAVAIYKTMIVDFPNFPEAYNNLAIHYANEGDFDSAISTLEGAFQGHNGYKTAYKNLQSIYSKLASDAYRKALDSSQPAPPLELTALDHIEIPADHENHEVTSIPSENVELENNNFVKIITRNQTATDVHDTKTTQSANLKVIEPSPTRPPRSKAANGDLNNQDIKAQVENWAKAWSDQDVERFLKHYSDEFTAYNNLSFEEWKKQLNGRLLWKEYIQVELSEIDIDIQGNNATANFILNYSSNLRKGVGKSSLQLQQFHGVWLITKEFI